MSKPVMDAAKPDRVWDMTDPGNPQALIWPECPTCHVAYVWRRSLSLGRGYGWYWMRDCKHKADGVLMTVDGPYASPSGSEGRKP